eukprot:scaffold13961_cov176-Amphora_coffeaeformis.AAC.2
MTYTRPSLLVTIYGDLLRLPLILSPPPYCSTGIFCIHPPRLPTNNQTHQLAHNHRFSSQSNRCNNIMTLRTMLRLNIILSLLLTAVVARMSGDHPIRALEKPPHIPIHSFRLPHEVDADELRLLQTKLGETNDTFSEQTKCDIIMDNFLGTEGVERAACQECSEDPDDPGQYILFCDFSSLCTFCSPEEDSCYTLTHEYKVRLGGGLPDFPNIVSYSACGIYHDDAEPNVAGRKACLDETFDAGTGELTSKCISVDDVSCDICEDWYGCDGESYWYGCANIEEDFFLDDCRPDFNDEIPKTSVFVGFNYGIYSDDTAACFDDTDGFLGNLPVPTATPTLAPTNTPTITARPTTSHQPTLFPTVSMEPSITNTNIPSVWPSSFPSQWPTYIITGSSSPESSSAPFVWPSTFPSQWPSYFVTGSSSPDSSSAPSVWPSMEPSQQPSYFVTGSSSPDSSSAPSVWPSMEPSQQPSYFVTMNESPSPPLDPLPQGEKMSGAPSENPSETPSAQPSSPSGGGGSTGQPTSASPETFGALSQKPQSIPSASPSYIPTSAPTKQSAVKLDEFSLTLRFDADSLLVNDVAESLTEFLFSQFSIEYSNFAGMDLKPTERVRTRGRRGLTSSTFDFEGVARFYNQAPDEANVRDYEANALANLGVLHGDWIVTEVVLWTAIQAREDSVTGSGCEMHNRFTLTTAAFVATLSLLLA